MLTLTCRSKRVRYDGDRVPVVGDRGMAVEAGVELDEGGQVGRVVERRVRVAVDPDHLGRHPLADLRLVARFGQDHQSGVAVEVDEARARRPGRSRRSAARPGRAAAGRPR